MPDVYRRLGRRACWSIREGGRVVGHAANFALWDVAFRVSAGGARRIQARRQREVVATARGILVESAPVPPGALRIRFNPYVAAAFVLPDGSPIATAASVLFLADGTAWAVPYPLGVYLCVSPSSPSR